MHSWTDSRILRFLQANRYKLDKTLTSIKENDRSLAERLPVKKTPFLDEFLVTFQLLTLLNNSDQRHDVRSRQRPVLQTDHRF